MTFKWTGWVLLLLLFGLCPRTGYALDEDARYLEVRDEYTCLPDGAMVKRHEHRIELLTLFACNRLCGETFIVYNPEFQSLKINEATTRTPDGRDVPCTPNAFNEVLPGFCASAPSYNHLREMVITHLGLERGVVVHLDYEIRSSADAFPFLMGEELFSSPFFTQKKTVVVRVPKGTELKHELLNAPETAPVVTEDGAFDQYEWTLQDLPGDVPERMGQDAWDHAPYLVFSTCPSWEHAAGLLSRALTHATISSTAIDEKIRELVKASADYVDLVRAINRFVVNEVADAPVDPMVTGFRPRPAEEVFQSNVGSPLDKAALLTTMIRGAGLFAEPVFISRHRAVSSEVPSWAPFDECRVLCTLRAKLHEPLFLKETLYLNPVDLVEGVFDDHLAGKTAFRPFLMNNHLQLIPLLKEEQTRVKAELNLKMNDGGGLTGKLTLDVNGAINPCLTLMDGWEGWAESRMKRLLPAGAELVGLRPVLLGEARSVFTATVEKPVTLKEDEGFLFYEVPDCPGGAQDLHLPISPEWRITPLWLPRPFKEEIQVTINLPASKEVAAGPEVRSVANDMGLFLSGSKVEDGRLQIVRILNLTEQLVSPEAYPEFRALLTEWEAEDGRRVLIR